MGTRRDYPFSRRAYKEGQGILSNIIFGLFGLGACAAEGLAKAAEKYDACAESDAEKTGKPSNGRTIALVSAFVIPLGFLLMRLPFIGEIAFIVLFVIFTEAISEEYPLFKDIGLTKRILALLSAWVYSFAVAYMIEDYMDLSVLLSLVPVLCFVLGYMKGWWQKQEK